MAKFGAIDVDPQYKNFSPKEFLDKIKKHNLPKEFGNHDLQDWIVELNDNEYWNFDAIADWIEDNVEAI